MPTNTDYSDTILAGQISFEKIPVVPPGSFGDPQIGAANPIDATKVKHQYAPQLAQAHGTAATAERRIVHVARAAGTVAAVGAGPVVAATGNSTVTVDVRKNGTSILTSTISLTSATAAFARVAGTINTAAYVAGDVFEVVVTVAAGTGTLPQGVSVQVVFREGAG
ncbi:Marine sediment metagenome DNA, contig: S03H2_L04701 OS=marine sediment metagenome GN=S03H2_18785 PE=4 SV=1 [Gemmataceae bacterium]|nr:Marine sediment metagenome DNA, contig: S03H2_L04701 OS=marine sediment metagenome GN=S03H2_18785 PE=4 SV=1 [Gemmataceae bacterium]VTU02779.1 Marine sediment metagenome DNA, contig: S03H2_L04701 OS=marine sediment metagenome GN=S03H2_18785 PE=4 SV=1 [Gemmataceae bacterium]